MMTNRSFALLLIVLLAGSGIAYAQSQPSADQLYSSGIHAFNSQRYSEAIGWFDQIESLGTPDPRAFFYRGLSYSRLGNATSAAADYEKASRIELTVAGRSYSVPKALERIQGRDRTVIEQYRRSAKRDWEAEQNVRKQDEFLSQKAEDMKLYSGIIESGKSETPSSSTAVLSDAALPFGAQPANPFATNQPTFRPRPPSVIATGELTEDNVFKEDVERTPVIEQPEEPVRPRTPPRAQDPNERGIFDFDDEDNAVEGFDSGILLQGGQSTTQRTGGGLGLSSLGNMFDIFNQNAGKDGFDDGFPIPLTGEDSDFSPFGDRGDDDNVFITDDDFDNDSGFMTMPGGGEFQLESATVTFNVDPVKDSGRSIGKGFASFFKKPGSSELSPVKPDVAPAGSQPTNTPDEDDDPFADAFGDDPF